MPVTPQEFPPRKRRPSAAAFISPNFSVAELVQYLLLLSKEISNLEPLQYLLRRKSVSVVRKVKLLAILYEELLQGQPRPKFSASAILCFEEMYILLQRIKTTIEDCSNGSKMYLLMQSEFVVNTFHELTADLSTLLDVFPIREVDLSQDVVELVSLVKNQCSQATLVVLDPEDETLRRDVIAILERIKREIVPEESKLADVFEKLGLCDSSSCREEMENLEEEVQNQADDKSKSEVIGLIGLVRYAKCVLYGGSTPPSRPDYHLWRRNSSTSIAIPSDFRCPITIDLMIDPVVVATGQTYDRESISLWIQSGHNTCPKTGQALGHTNLIPNHALKNLIALWCRKQRIPFETAAVENKFPGTATSKTSLEAIKMTASYLLTKLSASPSLEAANSVVYELRVLAKTDSDSRTCVAEAGAIPFLARYLGSDITAANPNLQVNAVTTILNLSILETNKTRIMEAEGAINGVIAVLQSGATWEAKGNAAATIFSLSGVNSYMKQLGRKPMVIRGLLDLAKDGPPTPKRDALAAILNLAGDRETAARLVEAGVIDLVRETMNDLEDEAATVLEAVVRRGGMVAIAAAYTMISKLAILLSEGSERVRESAAATLVMICRKGGPEAVTELATMPGIERVIWELMGMGTARTKRKAASLLRILRRWAAGLDNTYVSEAYTAAAASNVRSTQIMLPG